VSVFRLAQDIRAKLASLAAPAAATPKAGGADWDRF